MISAVFSGFVLSVFAWLIAKKFKYSNYILALLPFSLLIYFILNIELVLDKGFISESYSWIPSLGINFSFYLDGFSLIFSLLITLIGTIVVIYSGEYLRGNPLLGRFYVYLLMFMASMLGVVLSNNILTLFVFWELTSLSSYLLIGFNHNQQESRYAALQALLITGGGGLALLLGLIIMGNISGTYEISEIIGNSSILLDSQWLPLMMILILLGAFTKSAQFPFHFWLPAAMAAPTPVSTYLHSATMVKAGIYLLARFNPLFSESSLWNNSLIIFGSITMLFSSLLALKQTDLKKLLAYTTLSALGTLTMLIGIGTETAIKAAIIYLTAHALYKAALFLSAGIIDHETGTREITKLEGLYKFLPITGTAIFLAALSNAGVAPLIGFISKETVYEAVYKSPTLNNILLFTSFIANVSLVFVAALISMKPLLGRNSSHHIHEPKFGMWIGPLVLGIFSLLFGIAPSLIAPVFENAWNGISNLSNFPTVKLWHGFNFVFILSIITLISGIILYFNYGKLRNFISTLKVISILKPTYWYDQFLNSINLISVRQTKFLQNGYLQHYIKVILLTFIILSTYIIVRYSEIKININLIQLDILEIAVFIVFLVGTIITITAKSRLISVTALGIVGYGVVLVFLLYGAPDLAMTQFAIETLTIVLFVFVIYKLPKYLPYSNNIRRIKDVAISAIAGIIITIIVLMTTSVVTNSQLKTFFSENSLPEGKGRNIVNVILVDFRAIDTLGEITVLAIAALGVFSLIKLNIKKDQ